MSNKLSPKFLSDLEKNGIALTEKELKSLNEILPDSASELTIYQLNAVAGGKLSKLKKLGIAAAIATTAVLADVGQAYYRNKKDFKGMSEKSILLPAAKEVGSIARDVAHNSAIVGHVDINDAVKKLF